MSAADDIERSLAFIGVDVDEADREEFEREVTELEAALRAAGIDEQDDDATHVFVTTWLKNRRERGA